MQFPAIWRNKFTDLANSKKTQSQEKTAVDKVYIYIYISIYIYIYIYIYEFESHLTI